MDNEKGLEFLQGFAMEKNHSRKRGDKKPTKRPPKTLIKSIQFDLFGEFVTNVKKDVSNTIELWDRIPKYFPVRTLKEYADKQEKIQPFVWEYQENGHDYRVVLQPALVEDEKDVFNVYFPGTTEELVEEALKKILADQNQGIHDPEQCETWVKFSLSMVHRELKEMGCERNRNEIKHAIKVMGGCNLSYYVDGKEKWSGSILQDLMTVDRDEYIEDNDSFHAARLPVFISHAINHLDYRQFNYKRLMKCSGQLPRWIYKRLVHRYKHASKLNDYHFTYADLRNSGLLQQQQERHNRKSVTDALNELVAQGVLSGFSSKEQKVGRKVANVVYTVTPSSEFVKEQKAANKRAQDNQLIASGSHIAIPKPVDNSD